MTTLPHSGECGYDERGDGECGDGIGDEADFSGQLVADRPKMPQRESSLPDFPHFGIEIPGNFRNARRRGNFLRQRSV